MKAFTRWARRLRRRAKSKRGFTTVPIAIEMAMVFGWFVFFVVGEKAVSSATSARRASENATDESATTTSAGYCSPKPSMSSLAQTSPSSFSTPKPNVQAAISAIVGLGLGSERTFGYFLNPMQNARVSGQNSTSIRVDVQGTQEQHDFQAQRSMGCLERPLDMPMGSLDEYRMKIWITNLMGYK